MKTNADRNWELISNMLSAESIGKSPRLFSSRKTLFGIPSALDQELAMLDETANQVSENKAEKSEPTVDSKPSRGNASTVKHPLDPVFDEHSRVLVLGTMPSPKSRETGFYYNHPQNRFWKVMASLFDEHVPESNEEKRDLVRHNGVALWDVLSQCTIEGASDGTIADCVPNDIASLLAKAPIEAIFCTGTKASELYAKYCEPQTGVSATKLPSTSPANAAMSLDQLIEAYQPIKETLQAIR